MVVHNAINFNGTFPSNTDPISSPFAIRSTSEHGDILSKRPDDFITDFLTIVLVQPVYQNTTGYFSNGTMNSKIWTNNHIGFWKLYVLDFVPNV